MPGPRGAGAGGHWPTNRPVWAAASPCAGLADSQAFSLRHKLFACNSCACHFLFGNTTPPKAPSSRRNGELSSRWMDTCRQWPPSGWIVRKESKQLSRLTLTTTTDNPNNDPRKRKQPGANDTITKQHESVKRDRG